jgi:hypothetical protein
MSRAQDIKEFEEAVEAAMMPFADKLTKDEMIGTFELMISSLQEALEIEGTGG